jgi:hypothetical protein
MRATGNLGWKEGAEGLAAAAATAGVAKVAGVLGEKLKEKFGGSSDRDDQGPDQTLEAAAPADFDEGPSVVRH